ncbi:MAG: hypothetical protein H6621_06725 [Halobacteriovoraceae bacterium]|nr:hypothetical protein [Halobacteriovoraceae bacterium]
MKKLSLVFLLVSVCAGAYATDCYTKNEIKKMSFEHFDSFMTNLEKGKMKKHSFKFNVIMADRFPLKFHQVFVTFKGKDRNNKLKTYIGMMKIDPVTCNQVSEGLGEPHLIFVE